MTETAPNPPSRPAAREPAAPRRLIVSPGMLDGEDGRNINGPSLIRTPDWLPGRLGRYYLYFAHHLGRHIRMAFADRLEGPWTVHRPGTLRLEDLPGDWDHIASPDVHVDEESRRILMFFHGQRAGEVLQHSHVAVSQDGLSFASDGKPIAAFYLKAVRWKQFWIGLTKGGEAWVSRSPLEPFRKLPCRLFPMGDPRGNAPGDVRHVALELTGSTLRILYTRIGDAPERILGTSVDLRAPAANWRTTEASEVLRPALPWEGAGLPLKPSRHGASSRPEHALRDPAIFVDGDGRRYLLYAAAGESGIGITELPPRTAAIELRSDEAPTSGRLKTPQAREMLARLAAPGALQARLDEIDATAAPQRIYVMGCGRSGTWLLTALMSTFAGLQTFPDEVPVEAFGLLTTSAKTLLLKRGHRAYEAIERIPRSVKIACIVRHPFDVLTSHNPTSGRRFHIEPFRWLGEMLALQYLVDSRREGTVILRYEDLVADPLAAQRRIADAFGLEIESPPDAIVSRFKPSQNASEAMHGLRGIDTSSVGKYRNDPDKIAYLRSILPRLGRTLEWVAETYGYDIDLG